VFVTGLSQRDDAKSTLRTLPSLEFIVYAGLFFRL
jgi:hypothetical protein